MSEIPLTAAEPRTVEEITYHEELCERLKQAYMAALASQHIGWRTEIHIGSDVRTYLTSFARIVVDGEEKRWEIPAPTLWGFPIVETTAAPDAISVHAVRVIA